MRRITQFSQPPSPVNSSFCNQQTNSIEPGIEEANNSKASQEIPPFTESDVSLPRSLQPPVTPILRPMTPVPALNLLP